MCRDWRGVLGCTGPREKERRLTSGRGGARGGRPGGGGHPWPREVDRLGFTEDTVKKAKNFMSFNMAMSNTIGTHRAFQLGFIIAIAKDVKMP